MPSNDNSMVSEVLFNSYSSSIFLAYWFVRICNMAVDVMHLDPGQSFAKSAFGGKSRSIEELSTEHAYPTIVSPSSSGSPRSVSSLLDLTWAEEEEQHAIDRLQSSRKQLEDEIDVRACI